MNTETISIKKLKPNPANPRTIKDDKFHKLVQSVKAFPEMLKLRPENITWVDDSMVLIEREDKRVSRFCECKTCGNWFKARKYTKARRPLYCSTPCYAEMLKIDVFCKHCGKPIITNGTAKRSRINCSRECAFSKRKGVPLSDEWKTALSEGRKRSEKCKGPNLYNWKGGKSTLPARMLSSYYKRKGRLSIIIDPNFMGLILKAQNGNCFFCESSLENYKAIEHLTPVSRGGDNQIFNLVYACQSCNSQKRQQTLEEFAIKKRRFDWIDKFDLVYSEALVNSHAG